MATSAVDTGQHIGQLVVPDSTNCRRILNGLGVEVHVLPGVFGLHERGVGGDNDLLRGGAYLQLGVDSHSFDPNGDVAVHSIAEAYPGEGDAVLAGRDGW